MASTKENIDLNIRELIDRGEDLTRIAKTYEHNIIELEQRFISVFKNIID